MKRLISSLAVAALGAAVVYIALRSRSEAVGDVLDEAWGDVASLPEVRGWWPLD